MFHQLWFHFCMCLEIMWVFSGGSDSKVSACNVGDLGLVPGLGRSPGGGHGNPFQYSCLENPRGQRSLVGYSPWGCKESDMIKTKHTHTEITFLFLHQKKTKKQKIKDKQRCSPKSLLPPQVSFWVFADHVGNIQRETIWEKSLVMVTISRITVRCRQQWDSV